jgi:hypothetical protein
MRSFVLRSSVVLLLLPGAVPVAKATTIVPLRFDEVVRQAGVILEGTVTGIQVRTTGADLPPAPPRAVPASATAPISAGVEGGRTLFTEVTIRVDRQVGGAAGPEIRLTLAGGSAGGETVVVHGMPEFEIGGRYVLLLRPDFARTNVPVVGVSQGWFEIVRDPVSGAERLLNADGAVVLGVEGGRLAVRRDAVRVDRRSPRLGPPPVPEAGSGVRSGTHPQVERYWASPATPMTPGAFLDAVRAMKEVTP